jgi:hypothetical protein
MDDSHTSSTPGAGPPLRDGDDGSLAAALGMLGVLALALALVAVREIGTANVALLLSGVVMAACAAGGRRAGGATAVVAAVSFNFFHTRPYLSLDMDHGRDVLTLVLMVLLGLAAGEIARQGRLAVLDARHTRQALHRLGDMAEIAAHGGVTDEVVARVEHILAVDLRAAAVRVEVPAGPGDLPLVRRTGNVEPAPGHRVSPAVELVDGPVALPITFGAERLGRLVIDPGPGRHLDHEGVATAATAADQLAVALGHHAPGGTR